MKTQTCMILAAAAGAAMPIALVADALPVAETASACVYVADTMPSPRAVKTAEELGELTDGAGKVTYYKGDTVSVVAPSGTETTPVSDAAASGTVALGIDEGGLWTLGNSGQGTASFTVRHSLCGTQGAGTAESPAKLVDGDELVDCGAGDGYVFILEGGASLLDALRLPSGFRLEKADGDTWRIVTSADGCIYTWAEIEYPADSEREGPDRKTDKASVLPVAYSGDDWVGDMSKAATLRFISPRNQTNTVVRTGTGAMSFAFTQHGRWTVLLEMENGTTFEATINITGAGFTLIVK